MNNLKIAVVIDNERRRGQLTPDFIGDLRAANNPKNISCRKNSRRKVNII